MQKTSCNLGTCFLCQHCLPDWKELIAIKKRTELYKKGKEIISEGEEVKGIFFMYSGSAKVSKTWGGEKTFIVRFARSGDVLGLRGLGGDSVYHVSAVAMEDTVVCFIDNTLLDTILKTNPSVTYELMKVYASELQTAEKRMRDLVHMDVKGRIALALLEITAAFGIDGEGFIALPISRQDIASYAGTTYETIFKFFNGLVAQNIIATSGKQIRINDATALQAFISAPDRATGPIDNHSV